MRRLQFLKFYKLLTLICLPNSPVIPDSDWHPRRIQSYGQRHCFSQKACLSLRASWSYRYDTHRFGGLSIFCLLCLCFFKASFLNKLLFCFFLLSKKGNNPNSSVMTTRNHVCAKGSMRTNYGLIIILAIQKWEEELHFFTCLMSVSAAGDARSCFLYFESGFLDWSFFLSFSWLRKATTADCTASLDGSTPGSVSKTLWRNAGSFMTSS